MTQSAFKGAGPKGLDIIKEDEGQRDEEEDDAESKQSSHWDTKADSKNVKSEDKELAGAKIGEKVKSGVKKYVGNASRQK